MTRLTRLRPENRAALSGGMGSMWDASDEALLAGYASGESDAASVFVHRFQSKAVGLALAITGNRVDAEEVAKYPPPDVTIGHNVMVHCREIGDGALIGIGAILLAGARIGSECLIGAGALVRGGGQ